MIIVDSNQIRFVLPHSPALKLFSVVAQRAGHTLAITDVVLREIVRQHHEELTSATNGYLRARRALNELLAPPQRVQGTPRIPEAGLNRKNFIRREVERFEADIRADFLVLPTSTEDALAALMMEADHTEPGLNGAGARDASIWLTAARAAATPERDTAGRRLPVIFVSSDGDFTAPGKSRDLAPQLVNDATRKGRLVLKSTVVDAMDALGYPQQLVDAEEVTKQDAFERVLIDVAIDLADLSSRYMEKVAEAEVTVRLVSGQKGRRCSGDGTILTTVSGTWSIRFVFEWLPRRQGGYGGTPYKGLPMQIEGTALMVEERDKEAVVEFSPQMISVAGRDSRVF